MPYSYCRSNLIFCFYDYDEFLAREHVSCSQLWHVFFVVDACRCRLVLQSNVHISGFFCFKGRRFDTPIIYFLVGNACRCRLVFQVGVFVSAILFCFLC